MKHTQKVTKIDWLSYNVVQLEVAKPADFQYNAGDAVEIKVKDQQPGPFTMTNLPEKDYLQFVIRIYKEHHGKTEAISHLKEGDEISFSEPFNTFEPQKRAVFLAGGTGITPFIALIRAMYKEGNLDDCLLFFSNKSRKDLFLENELKRMLGQHYQNVITQDKNDPMFYGNIDESYLKNRIEDLTRPMLVCGPPAFNNAISRALRNIGVKEELIDLGS